MSVDLALAGGTVWPGPDQEPIREGVVLIERGTIVAVGADVPIPPGVRTLDCSGLTVTAGFWNSHVHFFERKWANAAELAAPELARQLADTFSRHGFTTVFDLGSRWENTRALRERIESGEVPGPRIRSTGEGLVPPEAMPPDVVMQVMGVAPFPAPVVLDAEQAAAAARTLLERGVDAIKLFASSPRGPSMPESAMRAAVDAAHGAGKPVFVHPNSGDDVRTAVRAGVDVLAHTTPRSGAWDDALLAEMIERRVALTPTLALWQFYLRHDRIAVQEQMTRTAIEQLRAFLAAGGTVLFGTDLGAVDPDPAPEYALMRAAGMSFPAILASLTTAPAERFGAASRSGRIAPGFDADLVAFEGELGAVRHTIR